MYMHVTVSYNVPETQFTYTYKCEYEHVCTRIVPYLKHDVLGEHMLHTLHHIFCIQLSELQRFG